MGMGNLYHFYPDDLGISMGVRGWWESDNVFVVEGNIIGVAGEELYSRYSFIFEGDQVSIEAWVWGSEETLTFSGRLEG